MELKLVYRILRKISDWSVSGFYSEVHVEGVENVKRDGPLIIASTHHNEIIDIATLAATIPHRRHVSFWAKSSMFVNPVTGAILTSTGAIPVQRNPNNGNGTVHNGNGTNGTSNTNPQANLFRESSAALAAGQVLGVFPEGTSYTQPGIVQIMPGAAWAAVDYVRWKHEEGRGKAGDKELTIVPVSIVYTDKARYQSRVTVRYGKPIVVSSYTEDIFSEGADVEEATRSSVRKVMAEVEHQMRTMSVNAPDWDTLYAAQMARDIIWGDPANIPLREWVSVSQSIVDLFTTTGSTLPPNGFIHSPDPPQPTHAALLTDAKTALSKYYALLRYTRITHASLNTLLPVSVSTKPINPPFLRAITHLPLALLNFILFVPTLLFYLPAYLTGTLAARRFVHKGEVEAESQFKAIFGGVGLGMGVGMGLGVVGNSEGRSLRWMWDVLVRLSGGDGDGGIVSMLLGGRARWALGVLSVAYSGMYVLVRWHNALVYGNYRRLKILLTFYKVCIGLLPQRPVNPAVLEAYTRPPAGPPNPFIKRNNNRKSNGDPANGQTKDMSLNDVDVEFETKRRKFAIPTRKLIRPLLGARKEAVEALEKYLEFCLNFESGERGEVVGKLLKARRKDQLK